MKGRAIASSRDILDSSQKMDGVGSEASHAIHFLGTFNHDAMALYEGEGRRTEVIVYSSESHDAGGRRNAARFAPGAPTQSRRNASRFAPEWLRAKAARAGRPPTWTMPFG